MTIIFPSVNEQIGNDAFCSFRMVYCAFNSLFPLWVLFIWISSEIMAGVLAKPLVKAKKYDWKDSNMALFGSQLERRIKKDAAGCEPAWQKCGKEVGLEIWRIVNFKVTEWPKEEYGNFYEGDSYIVLNTYKAKGQEKLNYDVHFWIGSFSTQDEYCTAAYKTVELDTYLNGLPVQHREIQEYESNMFRSYFQSITYLKGGAESGFSKVLVDDYEPRLLHFHGDRRGVEVVEITRDRNKLDGSDVYILDLGLQLYQWNGTGSNKDERVKAMQYLQNLKQERGGKATSEVLDQHSIDETHEFYKYLDQIAEDDDEYPYMEIQTKEKVLFRLSDESGSMSFEMEKKGTITLSDFDGKDVLIFDTSAEVFVWIGNEASIQEKNNAMLYAHNYLQRSDHPFVPITTLLQNAMDAVSAFGAALAA